MKNLIADVAVLGIGAVVLGAAVKTAVFLFEVGYNVF